VMMAYKNLFFELNSELVLNSNETTTTDFSGENLYRTIRANTIDYNNSVSHILKQFTKEQLEMVSKLLEELDFLNLFKELQEMKIYYQINSDPRNKENKSLYAKAVLPRFRNYPKRKHMGIHFGTLSNFPDGWTKQRKYEARLELIKKGYALLTGD
jgi:hypothetical protein